MCLAIPARIDSIDEDGLATVDILGVTRSASLDLTPQAQVGDFVLVHAGFAIEIIDSDSAQETIDLIMEFPELAGDEMPQSLNETEEAEIPLFESQGNGVESVSQTSTAD